MNLPLHTLIKRFLRPEDRDIRLHDLLHRTSDVVRRLLTIGCPDVVDGADGFVASISRNLLVLLAWSEVVADRVADGTAEDNKVEQGVGT